MGYCGGMTTVKNFVREVRPFDHQGHEHRFETPPGKQAQVDCAHFKARFTDEPSTEQVIWLAEVANGRRHGTTNLIVREAFIQERATLQSLPAGAFNQMLNLERRITRDGMVSNGKSVYVATLAEIITSLLKAVRKGSLTRRIKYLTRTSLLIIDEVGYLPLEKGGANLFFQLINARYERGAMI